MKLHRLIGKFHLIKKWNEQNIKDFVEDKGLRFIRLYKDEYDTPLRARGLVFCLLHYLLWEGTFWLSFSGKDGMRLWEVQAQSPNVDQKKEKP